MDSGYERENKAWENNNDKQMIIGIREAGMSNAHQQWASKVERVDIQAWTSMSHMKEKYSSMHGHIDDSDGIYVCRKTNYARSNRHDTL